MEFSWQEKHAGIGVKEGRKFLKTQEQLLIIPNQGKKLRQQKGVQLYQRFSEDLMIKKHTNVKQKKGQITKDKYKLADLICEDHVSLSQSQEKMLTKYVQNKGKGSVYQLLREGAKS